MAAPEAGGIITDLIGARIVADWFTDRQAGLDTVIVADTNTEAGELGTSRRRKASRDDGAADTSRTCWDP